MAETLRTAEDDVVGPGSGNNPSYGSMLYHKGEPMSEEEYDKYFGQRKLRTADATPTRARRASKES